jgi:hypothetical protein
MQDLGYPPALQPAQVVPSPQRLVQVEQPDIGQFNDLINSLGQFNQSLQKYGKQELDERIAEAPAKALEFYREAQKQTAVKVKDYVTNKVMALGSAPQLRRTALNFLGERMATDKYGASLFEQAKRVSSEVNPEDPEAVIAEVRKAFEEELGDNMFMREGASGVMTNMENSFRAQTRAAQDKAFEDRAINEGSSNVISALSSAFGKGADGNLLPAEAQAEGFKNAVGVTSVLAKSGVSNSNKIFAAALHSAAYRQISEKNFAGARAMLDFAREHQIVDPETGQKVGDLYNVKEVNDVINSTEDAIYRAEKQDEAENADNAGKLRQNAIYAGEALANELYNLNPTVSPEEVRAAVAEKYGPNNPLIGTIQVTARDTLSRNRQNAGVVTDPEVVGRALNVALDGRPDEALAMLNNSPNVSSMAKFDARKQIEAIRALAPVTESSQAKNAFLVYGEALSDFITTETDFSKGVYDQHSDKRASIQVDFQKNFNRMLHTAVQEYQASHPNMSLEQIKIEALGSMLDKVGADTVKAAKDSWTTYKESKGFGYNPGGKVTVNKVTGKNLTERMASASGAYTAVMNTTGGELTQEVAGALAPIRAWKDRNWDDVVKVGRQIASGEITSQPEIDGYLQIRKTFGLTPTEVINGRTSDGVALDLNQMRETGEIYKTGMFGSYEKLQASRGEYVKLASEVEGPDADKALIDAKLETTEMGLLLKRLGLTTDAEVQAFLLNQEKIMRSAELFNPSQKSGSPKAPADGSAQIGFESETDAWSLARDFTDWPGSHTKPKLPENSAVPSIVGMSDQEVVDDFYLNYETPPSHDWLTKPSAVLAHRKKTKSALYEVLAEYWKIPPTDIGDYQIPGRSQIHGRWNDYKTKFNALTAEEKAKLIRLSQERARNYTESPIKSK